jgi:putative glutamine amidotransferase
VKGAPVIGVTAGRVRDDAGRWQHRVADAYLAAVRAAGGCPLVLPVGSSPDVSCAVDGLLLTGGGDIDPALYGCAPAGTELDSVDPERDRTELELVRAAPPGLPILAICRGIQVLAVAFGGTLLQDIPAAVVTPIRHRRDAPRHVVAHVVDVHPASRLASLVGRRIGVNSFHHQAVKTVPPPLRPCGWSLDGLIEAVEAAGDTFRVGVQWHPEDLVPADAAALALFRGFVAAAGAYGRDTRG